jgi:general secretion pathway protein E
MQPRHHQKTGKIDTRRHDSYNLIMVGQRYTFDYVLEALLRSQVIQPSDAADVALKESGQRYRLESEMAGMPGRNGMVSVSPAELLASFSLQTRDGDSLNEDRIMEYLAKDTGHSYYKIDMLKLDPDFVTSSLPLAFARKNCILPLQRRGNVMLVATDNPFNLDAVESIRVRTNGKVEVVLSSKGDILRCLRELYGFRKTLKAAETDLTMDHDLGNLEQLFKLKSFDEIESNDRHVVNAVDYMLHYAFSQRASDIHLEPKRHHSAIRLRIDGVLHTVNQVPRVVHKAIVSRIKTLGRLDIAEKRRPQDGRFKVERKEGEVELRVSTLPVAFGEKLVLRIFDPLVLLQDLVNLGFEAEQLASFQAFLSRPNGFVLVTGPTGSGKTTTLYSALQTIATDEINVTSIEDPIEMVVEEFNQTAVRPKVGITFASALRTLLRQDPDVIMVGEIRDSETAQHAVQAALTGHLVISTLHTNDSASAITRLLDLDMEPYLIASTLVGVLAQRLVRRVCLKCKTDTVLNPEQIRALGIIQESDDVAPELPVSYGKGCVECRHTGLKGRTAVYEIMPMTPKIQRLVMDGSTAKEIMKVARQDGMKTLRESAVEKLVAGETSFEEVLRVTVE